MSVATGVIKGRNLVGLQPDDRMPNDWLRMVARVFAAYRLTPLEKSVVAYIDGFHLSIESYVFPEATIGITDGQAFVDDQFIGYNDAGVTPESSIKLDVNRMTPDVSYSVVLCYTWVNIMPPTQSGFDIVLTTDVDDEHMLELGRLIRHPGDDLELIDDKRPWYWEMLLQFIGDTEIDGPGSNRADSKELPFLIAVKADETMDIGWALDFHCQAGRDAEDDPNGNPINHHDYDVRLSSYDTLNPPDCSTSTDENLYINGRPILTAPDNADNNPGDLDNDIHDPGCNMNSSVAGGDKFGTYHANLRLVDSDSKYNGYYSKASNSEYVGLELATFHPSVSPLTGLPTAPIDLPNFNGVAHGATLSHWHKEHETHLINYYNFDDPCAIINDFKLGNQPFDVTINNEQILTYNDFTEIPPELIFFIGKFPIAPGERYPNDPTKPGVALENGDMYYDTTMNAYYFWEGNRWSMVGSNAPVLGGMYEYIAETSADRLFPPSVGQDDFAADPDFTIVSRAGIILSEGEDYIGILDGSGSYWQQIELVRPAEADERINIYTINVGEGHLPDSTVTTTSYQHLVTTSVGGTTHPVKHNQDFNLVSTSGVLTSAYTSDGNSIIFDTATTTGQSIQLISVTETENRLGFVQPDPSTPMIATDGINTFAPPPYNIDFVMVFVDGLMLAHDDYDASDTVSVKINNMTAGQEVQIYSIIDEEGLGSFIFFDYEETVTAASKKIFTWIYDAKFAIVTVDGILQIPNVDYVTSGSGLTLTQPAITGQVVRLYSMKDTMGSAGTAVTSNLVFNASSQTPTIVQIPSYGNAEFTGDGNTTDFIINNVQFTEAPVSINGSRIRPSDYAIEVIGNTTKIKFNVAPVNASWIIVDYVY